LTSTRPPLVRGPWKLKDLPAPGPLKVFSCFHCGGGSSMGYKLAGMDVLGGVEIDPEMMRVYRGNHKPKLSYLMGVQEFKRIPNEQLPAALFNLDILDGSPPCSSFSMAGSREKKWGVASKFREGQSVQVLDDLFFDFIDIAAKLKPKVVIAENVSGLIKGNARGYVKEIFEKFRQAGYDTQLFLLNASMMGVPQRRERVFFIARPPEWNKFALNFCEPVVSVQKAWADLPEQTANALSPETRALWKRAAPGESMAAYNNGNGFNNVKLSWANPCGTVAASGALYHPKVPRMLSDMEILRLQSFPDDYNFGTLGARYVCGMSVPPFMMQRVADAIARQWGV